MSNVRDAECCGNCLYKADYYAYKGAVWCTKNNAAYFVTKGCGKFKTEVKK